MLMLLFVAITVFVLNIPFGYWRERVRKFSLPWVLSIHLPVPIVMVLRLYSGIGWELYTYLLLVTAYFIGQYIGVRIHQRMARRLGAPLSACLVMDVWRRTSMTGGSGRPRE